MATWLLGSGLVATMNTSSFLRRCDFTGQVKPTLVRSGDSHTRTSAAPLTSAPASASFFVPVDFPFSFCHEVTPVGLFYFRLIFSFFCFQWRHLGIPISPVL